MSRADLVFVCLGNICRSAMAEQVARAKAFEAGAVLDIGSAGISGEEHGNPIDPRAARCLRAHGYEPGSHLAHRITRDELRARLLVAMETYQVARLVRMGADAGAVRLLTDFVPGREGTDVPDPWYGGPAGFESTLEVIEAAMPALLTETSTW